MMEAGAILFLVFIGLLITAVILHMTGIIKVTQQTPQVHQNPVNNMTGQQQLELGVVNSLLSNVLRKR